MHCLIPRRNRIKQAQEVDSSAVIKARQNKSEKQIDKATSCDMLLPQRSSTFSSEFQAVKKKQSGNPGRFWSAMPWLFCLKWRQQELTWNRKRIPQVNPSHWTRRHWERHAGWHYTPDLFAFAYVPLAPGSLALTWNCSCTALWGIAVLCATYWHFFSWMVLVQNTNWKHFHMKLWKCFQFALLFNQGKMRLSKSDIRKRLGYREMSQYMSRERVFI